MTTDPHLEADCAWLQSCRIVSTMRHTPRQRSQNDFHNARIDRLIARAGGGETVNGKLVETLIACAERFSEYAALHAAKPDTEKSRRNSEMADMCLAAVADHCAPKAPASPVGGDGGLLPYTVEIGSVRFQKGIKLETFINAARRWHERVVGSIASSPPYAEALASPAPEGWVMVPIVPYDIFAPQSLVKAWGQHIAAQAWHQDPGHPSAVGLVAMMLQGWSLTPQEADAYARGFNRAQAIFKSWLNEFAAAPPVTIRDEGS